MKYCIVFVCQGGPLEVKSAILAASLIRQLRCDFKLIAAVPSDGCYKTPSSQSLSFLKSLGISITSISNPIDTTYPIANKMACLDLFHSEEKIIFLDSDMLCMNTFHHDERFENFQINGKLEDWHHHELSEWQTLYNYTNLSAPELKYKSTVFNEPMPLNLNTGFLAVDSNIDFGSKWIAIAKEIDAALELPRKRPNLDQLTCPITILKNRFSIDLLGEEFNYPAELRPVDHNNLPIFCHYHDTHMILCDVLLCRYIQELCHEHIALQNLLLQSEDEIWNLVLSSI